MTDENLAANVSLDAKTYRRFSTFDALLKDRRWVRPLLFAVFFLALAAVCFVLSATRQGALVLGIVLVLVGLGVPGCWLGTFFLGVNERIRRFRLDKGKPRHAYRVTFSASAVTCAGDKGEPAVFPWENIHGAYVGAQIIYLYVEPGRAYLLPADAVQGGTLADVAALLTEKLGAGRIHAMK